MYVLQQQKLIELIRDKDIEGALEYAQNYLSERGEENPDVLNELEKTLALLAFENPENSPFGELLHPSQRQKVRQLLVRMAVRCHQTLRKVPLIFLVTKSAINQKSKCFGGIGIFNVTYIFKFHINM